MTTNPNRAIPDAYAETVYEAERIEIFNSTDTSAKLLLDANEAAAMQHLRPGTLEWATFIAARLNLR